MRLKVTLPRDDEHVPEDGRMPDGNGAPVWLGIGGPVVGEVVGWRDLGTGKAVVEMEVELPRWLQAGRVVRHPDDLSFGLDANALTGEDGEVLCIEEIIGVVVSVPAEDL